MSRGFNERTLEITVFDSSAVHRASNKSVLTDRVIDHGKVFDFRTRFNSAEYGYACRKVRQNVISAVEHAFEADVLF